MVASTSTIRLLAGRARNLSAWQPLAFRDFRLLFIGQAVSLLGDQFYLVALPWLVLQLTGSGLALGTILTVLVLLKTVSLWQLFVLAAAFGTLDAFFSPAMKAFIPALLNEEKL